MAEKYGKFRATVVNRDDPMAQGRLFVESAAVGVEGEFGTAWTTACVPAGQVTLPDVGDTVWIEFEEGDLDRPLWTGCAWSARSTGQPDGSPPITPVAGNIW